ncbi:PD-(D/E)XK nuclease family protein [Candidatus Macondimonas diazotrophica]|jgi:hypothetical protein|uniref:PD-(D/E)XK endonuclease-like domain-containing protein n=1 Tax=Candidatus Macondimonas diazotrophica TaxID=2305248 RepID=A0A4Z0F880_9GAMM|nr:PD-(D/E)XK nuclease family protein [Candidatus Macondimonas diazotrophica]TFZ81674.1 hypothetical protein E4680_11430 [Candidatus Macondimonas diazotrophica]
MDFSILDDLLDGSPTEQENKIPVIEIVDDGTQLDPRLLFQSYSSLQLLHACPRKYQLHRLRAQQKEDRSTNVTFAFGHAVGDGVAELLLTKDLDAAIWKAVQSWDVGFEDCNEKQQKSLPHVILALEIFETAMQENTELKNLQVMHWHDKPAIELGFKIRIPGTLGIYSFRGFMDLVMRDEETGRVVVIENKTSSGNWVNHFSYKNSAQALGYSVILDVLEPEDSAYEVLYNIYMTKLKRWETFPFVKNKVQKARWIESIFHDIAQIEYFVQTVGNYGHWPMRGESCTAFGRVCEFMDICHLETANLITAPTEADLEDPVEAQFEFNVEDILK